MASAVTEAVRQAGVVGAGGAGFPTYVKLSGQVAHLVVNAAECEPLVRIDPYLLGRFPELVLRGLQIAMETSGARHGYIAIKAKHQKTVSILREALLGRSDVTLFLLDDFYPAGDEHVLVHEVLGRTVPQGGIPPQAGALVQNVQTLLNVAAAVDHGQPVLEKWVTVAGWVQRPVTVRVAVGTPVQEVIALAGGARGEPFAVIGGGPMMGPVLTDLSQPVTRVTGSLIVLPADHKLIGMKSRSVEAELKRAASACCGCQECTSLCPRHLLGHHLHPHRIARLLSMGVAMPEAYLEAYLCSQCGVCDKYACPMGISPRSLYARVRSELLRAGAKNPFQGQASTPHPYRHARRVPISRLVARLGLAAYDLPAPMQDAVYRPQRVTLPLLMGAGTPAEPVVAPGVKVRRGDVVARALPGKLGVPVHASIDGLVEAVSDSAVVIRSGV